MTKAGRRDPYRLVDTTLGKYEIEDLVGIGGMGAVYRARHVNVKKRVALKILKPDLALGSPELVKLFFDEAEKVGRLYHPNIINVNDADMADGIAFLVMDWIDGRTLDAELAEKGPFEVGRVAKLLEQICEAVEYAHRQQIVHRDLKPSNIMICADHLGYESVRILDFGIAKALDSTLGLNSRVLGAPNYASPEQLTLSAVIDQRSDVYSLGVTIYQLLTGLLPFDAESIEKVIQQHLTVSPPELRIARPELSEAVEAVVLRALAKRPEERFQSATALARAFRQAANVEPGALSILCTDASDRPLPAASFYLDGKYAGQSDEQGRCRLGELAPREYRVEASCTGYRSEQQDVSVESRGEASVALRLNEIALGELSIKTGVPRAQVFLNGALAGTTDQAGALHLRGLEPGDVEVEVRSRGRVPAAQGVRVVKRQTTEVTLALAQGRGMSFPRPSRRALAVAGGVLLACAAVILLWVVVRSGAGLLVAAISTTPTPAPTPDAEREAALLRQKARDEAATLVQRGDELYERKPRPDNTGAEKLYGQAVSLDPDNPEYHFKLGAARLGLQRYRSAADAFREAVAREGENHRYHNNLGFALSRLDDPGASDEALDEFHTAIRLAEEQDAPRATRADYYKYLARALMDRGQINEGNAAYDTASLLEEGGEPSPAPEPSPVGIDAPAYPESTPRPPGPTPTREAVTRTPMPTPVPPPPRPPNGNANGPQARQVEEWVEKPDGTTHVFRDGKLIGIIPKKKGKKGIVPPE